MMKPRLLIISPVTPYPVHHGAGSAIYGYLRALRNSFDIIFVGFCPEIHRQRAQEGLNRLCYKALLFKAPPARHLDAFSETPFLFSNLKSREMQRAINRIIEEDRPDLVQVEYLAMADYAERAKVRRIIRAHVQEWWHYYLNWRQVRGIRPRLENLFWSLDAIRHNRKVLQEFDWVLVTSEPERQRALDLVPQVRAEALPFLLMDCDYFRPSPSIPRDPQILFVGFLPHTPNTDALRDFLCTVWPILRKDAPEARLVVVGEGASNELRGFMHDQGVDYRGFVRDLREMYHQTRVYIAPVTSGGGIRTKIVEAMTAGIPIVCNSFAPMGLGITPDRHAVVRDRPDEAAAGIVRLLRDDDHWLEIRNAARSFVENSFGLEQVGPRIAQRYIEFLNEAA